jgi:hypothetical protein
MHATRDTLPVIERNLAGGRVMRGVRLLVRFGIPVGWVRGCDGWRSCFIQASPAVVDGLTPTQAGGVGRGAWRSSPLTKRVACGGLKVDAI